MLDEVRLGLHRLRVHRGVHYLSGLRYVPGARVVASCLDRRRARGRVRRAPRDRADVRLDGGPLRGSRRRPRRHRHARTTCTSTRCGGGRARQGRPCTKPLGRNAAEAAEMLRLVREAGVFHGYLENDGVQPGGHEGRRDGRLGCARARPHDALARGSLGSARRPLLGCRDRRRRRASRHGLPRRRSRPRHRRQGRPGQRRLRLGRDARSTATRPPARTTPIAIVRFEDGRTATDRGSWTAKGGIEVRNEVYCERGRIVQDIDVHADPRVHRASRPATSRRRPMPTPAGSSRSPTSRARGPRRDDPPLRRGVPRRARAARDVPGRSRRQRIIDAAYRSMRSGRWEPVGGPRRGGRR